MTADFGAMPRYRCHKEVRAWKILAIEFREDGAARIAPVSGDVFDTTVGYRAKFSSGSTDLGYFVIYDDGYQSWSPTKTFEEGYVQV